MIHDDDRPTLPRPSPWLETLVAALLVSGYGALPLVAGFGLTLSLGGVFLAGFPSGATALLLVVSAWVALVLWTRSSIVRAHWSAAVVALEILVLVVLPVWGLAENHLVSGDCVTDQCDATPFFRPFAEPEVLGLVAGHAVAALAYVVSRRRPERVFGAGEVTLGATLLFGCVLEVVAAIQLGPWILGGVVAPPLLLPALEPLLATALFAVELRARLVRRGRELADEEHLRAEERARASLTYRASPAKPHRPAISTSAALARAVSASPVILGAYAVLHAAWLGHAGGALDTVTRTCSHTLSTLPVVVLPQDCHYLCTVAARGHASLVRPIRVGRRGGIPILVNRQLALANAFEDLLHDRAPRFGRFARRLYDRLGLPLSRCIQSRWASDAVYLAMKPVEWSFYLALLLFDRESPERRIDRMYR